MNPSIDSQLDQPIPPPPDVHPTQDNKPRFCLGQIVATPNALEAMQKAMQKAGQNALEMLKRHINGDWGEIDAEDRLANDQAVDNGGRILSAYSLKDGTKLWIITEADRSSTCILLPEDY